jgi:peptidoglycan/LPS O-acetylase OafA/YrhL
LRYRADIDGLRAVAVLCVVGYHARIGLLRGGFVGVDVFFVISGYLISSIILADIAAGNFSYLTFYERRLRRIFPALIAVMVVTSLLVYLYFLPVEVEAFAKSLLAAIFSSSNIYFWRESGYFGALEETKPLLHTWSLAVEEQFYFLLPTFLVLAHRLFPRKIRHAVMTIAIVSFAVSVVGVFKYPDATFYLAHTRAWELLLGVCISLGMFPQISRPVAREVAAISGIGMICLAAIAFSSTTPFPGLAAVVPCFGAVLLIVAGGSGDSLVKRVLSCKPFVFIGLISYSLYLWHWPVMVFQGTNWFLKNPPSGRMGKLVPVFISIAIATASWKYIELPFRAKVGRLKLSQKGVFRFSFAAVAVIAVIGITTLITQGFPDRYPSKAIQLGSYLRYDVTSSFRQGDCFISSKDPVKDLNTSRCLQQVPGKQNYLLLGDSHAAHLWYGLETTFSDINLMQATASGCKPTIDHIKIVEDDNCRRMMNYIYTEYLTTHHVDKLLIAARWQGADLSYLSGTLDWAKAHGISVVLFGPIIQYDQALPRLLAFSVRDHDLAIPDHHRLDERQLDASMAQMALDRHVSYISFYRVLCGSASCEEFGGKDVPLQYDYGHLTREGSVLVAQRLQTDGGIQ